MLTFVVLLIDLKKMHYTMVVVDTGDAEDTDDGWNSLYLVLYCDVEGDTGKLEWIPFLTAGLPTGCQRPYVDHVKDYKVVGDDIIDLMRERGVEVICLPEAA